MPQYLPSALAKRPESRIDRLLLIGDDLSLAAQQQEPEIREGFEGITGESLAMERVFALARRVAPTDGTVLLTGESGTGKEVFARAIHRLSRRKEYPLLACDCSALAPTLLESELFGHVKGSYSGAIATKQGLFEAVDRGTLFLDEVGNLSMETQAKLLRVLETRRVKKVGDTAEREVEIRLISATNRELSEMVREGAFREDLYYRLNVVPIHLPPLRERQGDISRLAISFLDKFCRKNEANAKGFSPEAMCLMESYAWPGNVRELRNRRLQLVRGNATALLQRVQKQYPDDFWTNFTLANTLYGEGIQGRGENRACPMRKEFSDECLLPTGLDGGFGLLVGRRRVRRAVAARRGRIASRQKPETVPPRQTLGRRGPGRTGRGLGAEAGGGSLRRAGSACGSVAVA